MKTNKEIKEWILANCVDDDGDIDISNLDFSDFEGNVIRRGWKVRGNLAQNYNKVKGNLIQNSNEVGGNLYQERNKTKGNLWQHLNEVKGKTHNDFKYHHKVMKLDEEKGWVKDDSVVRQLEDMTKEELIEEIREMRKQLKQDKKGGE